MISTNGTDGNSVMLRDSSDGSTGGYNIHAVDNNNLTVQTGFGGVFMTLHTGYKNLLDSDDYYYKITVFKLG